MTYKPGTILKPTSNNETVYFEPPAWLSISEDTVVMVLSTELVTHSLTSDDYYYELLVGDKHAQHHKYIIENIKRWVEVKGVE